MTENNAMKLSNIKEIFRQNIGAIAYAFLLSILVFIPLALSPIYRLIFTDHIFTENRTDWLLTLMVLMGITAALAGVVNWLQNNCLFRLSSRIEGSNLNRYMWVMFNSPLKLFSRKDNYKLLSQSEKSSSISKLLTEDILSLLFDTIRVVFYLIIMLRIDTAMALIVIALVVANVVFTKVATFLRDRFAGEEEEADADALIARGERIYATGLQNIETVKSTVTEPALFGRLMGAEAAVINAKRSDDVADARSPIEDLPEVLFLNILLLISALRIMDREFSIGTYLEFQAYASAFFYPLSGVLSIRSQLKEFEEKLTEFFKELGSNTELKSDVREREEGGRRRMVSKRKFDGYIEFKNVSFAYNEDIPVIKDFNLSVKPRQRVAIIGKSGVGKTTLLKLLQGLYEPDSGEITIDGVPVSEIDREVFKNSVGCANQEIAIFSASIRENITMWDRRLTDVDIYKAAQDACIHQYISSLDGAYECRLTENGNNISRGQCQRIEVARALIYNPSIILFDEAMSSIDPVNREHIHQVLKKRGCTGIMVTHLLSRITNFDEIVILGKAKVIARGTHDELMDSSPFYKASFEAEKLVEKI
jgi:ABC-type bacteriocin/lantibiotic exporter with double-glycine peptidase domain